MLTQREYWLAIDSEALDLAKKGVSDWSPVAEVTVAGDDLAPAAPLSLTASSVPKGIRLDWTNPSTNADGTTCVDQRWVKIYWKSTAGVSKSDHDGNIVIAGRAGESQAWTDTNIDATTERHYVVTAIDTNGNESIESNEAYNSGGSIGQDTNIPDDASGHVFDDSFGADGEGIAVGDGMLGIIFQQPDTTWVNFDHYRLWYAVDSGSGFGAWTEIKPINQVGFIHKGLNTAYHYKYKATIVATDGTESSIPDYATNNSNTGDGGPGYQPNAGDNSLVLASTILAERIVATDEVRGENIYAGSTIEIASNGHIYSGQTDYDTGIGWWLGDVSGTAKFSIGDPSGSKLTWDGSSLSVCGSITILDGSGISNLSDAGALATLDSPLISSDWITYLQVSSMQHNSSAALARGYATDSNVANIRKSIYYKSYVYGITDQKRFNSRDERIIRFNPRDKTTHSIAVPDALQGFDITVSKEYDKIWWASFTAGRIFETDPTTMTTTLKLELPGGGARELGCLLWDGSWLWAIIGTTTDDFEWAANTSYSVGAWVSPTTPNGYHYKATVAGTSGSTEPTWPTTVGATVTDGSVTWECISEPVKVFRIDVSDWSYASHDIDETTVYIPYAVNADADYLYIVLRDCHDRAHGKIVKYKKATGGNQVLDVAYSMLEYAAFDGTYLYCGTDGNDVLVVDMSSTTPSIKTTITFPSSLGNVGGPLRFIQGKVWCTFWNTPGQIAIIDPVDLSYSVFSMETNEDYLSSIATDGYNVFITTWQDPAKMICLGSAKTISGAVNRLGVVGNSPPLGAGLYLGSDYLGYYDSAAWKTYMDSDGNFYLGGTGGKLQWDASTNSLTISGTVTIEGGSGISNLSDAGDLATKDLISASDCDTTIISGGKIVTNLLTADNIQTGTLDASVVNVTNLNASNITTGTLSASRIYGGTLDFGAISRSGLQIIQSELAANSVGHDQLQTNSVHAEQLYIDGDINFSDDGTYHKITNIESIHFASASYPYIFGGSTYLILYGPSSAPYLELDWNGIIKLTATNNQDFWLTVGGDTIKFKNATTSGGQWGYGYICLEVNGTTRAIPLGSGGSC